MNLLKLLSSGRHVHKNVGAWRRFASAAPESCPPCDATEKGKAEKKAPSESSGGRSGLVLGVFCKEKGYELTASAQEFDQKSGGKISKHLNELGDSCRLEMGQALMMTDVVPDYSAVALTCYGPQNADYNILENLDEKAENVRWGVGAGVARLSARGLSNIHVDVAGQPEAAAEAASLAAWKFNKLKTRPNCSVQALVSAVGASSDGWQRGAVKSDGQNWARFLSDMPANMMTPTDLAQAALDVLCPLGVSVIARERAWIASHRFEALLAVSRGSCQDPIFLECEYNTDNSKPPILLVAKGVTFDSGGLCLKKRDQMLDNRGSMAGAAVVLGALKALAVLKAKVNVRAAIPLCENMISGQCMKVGDVVRALDGTSIQIEDTDLEGRLMMADALVYGQEKHNPKLVIDVATMTNGVLQATGGGAFGAFASSDSLWSLTRDAGALTGDRPWRFPLWDYYKRQITNENAVDLRNKGSGSAQPCIGAAFLNHFVCGPWVHFDITGVGKLPPARSGAPHNPPYLAATRMTGRPTRTLFQLIHDFSENKQPQHRDGQCQKC